MSLLALTNTHCHYRTSAGIVRALDGVTLTIEQGKTTALVGESGCGKTTLARTVLGLAPLTDGSIHFDGVETRSMDRQQRKNFRRRVQAVFQDPYSSLNPRLTIGRILAEPMQAHGVDRATRQQRIARILEMVGLEPGTTELYPHEFSGGQRQRIAIARALTLEPELIVLDEPTSALDVSIRAQILNLLSDLQRELNLTYLLIAHDLALVSQSSDRVAVMYLGRVVEQGPTERLFQAPRHPYTQALLRAVPRPDPRIRRDSAALKGEVASALAIPTGCAFHPRCPMAEARCRLQRPELSNDNHHNVACWLASS